MKKLILILLVLIAYSAAHAIEPKDVIKKAEDKVKGKTMHGIFMMRVVTSDYIREVRMESWWTDDDKALIEILDPAKEKGNKTLKIGNEMWNYMQSTETKVKVPPSMMLQSWNGSDLTNDDIVRESDYAEDYTMKLLPDVYLDSLRCWKIELTPKPDAPVVWGKVVYYVYQIHELPAMMKFYDEKGDLVRTMLFTDIKEMNGRKIPAKWTIKNENKKDRFTEFIYEDAEFDVKIPSRKFSLRELER